MIFKCCLCGKAYTCESAAVKCVNRCARAAHQKGIFQTKSVYSEGTTTIEYNFESENNLKEKCISMLNSLGLAAQNSFRGQIENWDKLSEGERTQVYDMMRMTGGRL